MLVEEKLRKYNLGPSYLEQVDLNQTGYFHLKTKNNKKLKIAGRPFKKDWFNYLSKVEIKANLLFV